MSNQNWHGIMKVLEIKHIDKKGNIIFQEKNILNTLHKEGEKFILGTCFGGYGLPEYYYLGLDNRKTVKVSDNLNKVHVLEPTNHGYLRQAVSSREFSITSTGGGHIAKSPVVIFRASGNWDIYVRNLFLTDTPDQKGTLISTATIADPILMKDGETVSLRIGLTLKNI